MPPKVKITKEDIVKTALELVRKFGVEAINARGIAVALNCSTQPIFSNFETMEKLRAAIVAAAYEVYLSFLKTEAEAGKYPKYKAFGMAYIRFAIEERELFKLLFMRDRNGAAITPTEDFSASVEMIMKANSISREKAELLHLEMWATVHGIASMSATAFFELPTELISDMISDIYQGLCLKFSSEG